MKNKVAILRGINVGGKRKIRMADLRLLCQKLSWQEVTTYIQSGNVIFKSEKENKQLECELSNMISDEYGFHVPVIIRDGEELKDCINRNPFLKTGDKLSKLHLTFLKEKPCADNVAQVQKLNFEPDLFFVFDRNAFIYCEGKYHESKLTNSFFEKNLKVETTTRNWKTVLKLQDLVSQH